MYRLLITMAAVTLPISASAQNYQLGDPISRQERRAALGITIPFGKGGRESERKPRLELAFDHRQHDANGLEIRDGVNQNTGNPIRLGLTLSKEPKMMMNGRELPKQNIRNNVSTAGWIAIGVVAVGGLAYGFFQAMDASSE
jgi:hypothetical protein